MSDWGVRNNQDSSIAKSQTKYIDLPVYCLFNNFVFQFFFVERIEESLAYSLATLKRQYYSSVRCLERNIDAIFALLFWYILRFGARARDVVSATTTTLFTCTRGGVPFLYSRFLSESTSTLTITAWARRTTDALSTQNDWCTKFHWKCHRIDLHRKCRIRYLILILLFSAKDLLWTRTSFLVVLIGSWTIELGVV